MQRAHHISSLYHGSSDSGIGRITTLALLEDSKGTPGRDLRKLDSYALVYVYEGTGFYRNTHQQQRIHSGDLIFIYPDELHANGPIANERWNELFLLFDGMVFELWQQQGLLNPAQPVLNLQPISSWMAHFKSICSVDSNPLKQICRLQTFIAEAAAYESGTGAGAEAFAARTMM